MDENILLGEGKGGGSFIEIQSRLYVPPWVSGHYDIPKLHPFSTVS